LIFGQASAGIRNKRECYFSEILKTAEITIYLPGGMLAAGISLYLFYEYYRVKDAKQLARRESLDNVRQQYLRD